jgi:hypothetical protein
MMKQQLRRCILPPGSTFELPDYISLPSREPAEEAGIAARRTKENRITTSPRAFD